MTEFDYEVKQKKALVPSARRRKCGSRSKACSLPSDNLTEGARKKLNGECVTINMNKPIKYKDLIKVSEDLQRQYIKRLQDDYNASVRMLEPMLGISYPTVRKYLAKLGLTRDKHAGHTTQAQCIAWKKFCDQEDELVEKIMDAVAKAPIVSIPVETEKVDVVEIKDDDCVIDTISIDLEGQAFAVCKKLISIVGASTRGKFRIIFEAEGGIEDGEEA